MCAKREPEEIFQPMADLDVEFQNQEFDLRDLPFIGPVVFYGFLENI